MMERCEPFGIKVEYYNGTRGLRVCQENVPPTPLHQQQPDLLTQGRMDPGIHGLYAKF